MSAGPAQFAGDPEVDIDLARAHGLSDAEYEKIKRLLGRTPVYTELGVFSVMWSEHCSYKSSRSHLRKLPAEGERFVKGPGENAGVIDVGDGWVAVFKIESHNHPSFVEPYQGAATGVGGILRDIFAMGARPVASMNSLKFGSFENPRTRYLLSGVVAGIGGYGNCVGVPTVGGEVTFDSAFDANILVNAFCLGLARIEDLQSARARGSGNPLIYVGSATGRDGIHGASLLASAEFDATSEQKRPTVQVGDPFAEKLLIEACLEAIRTGAIVALQDMGAAGLTSSSSEMAARGGLGVDIDLERIPLRETGLTPYEILLSESQERMLIVAEKGREDDVIRVFDKWEVNAVAIGTVTSSGRWRVLRDGGLVADIPIAALTQEAPEYERPMVPPKRAVSPPPEARPGPEPRDALRRLLDSPNVGSRKWVFRQYDYLVQGNTVVGPGSDAAVLRIKGSPRGLALAVDSNPRACAIDPYLGTTAAVCEAARNVACAGARPVGITNCLNYGNPEHPEIMWQFARGVEGLRDAARALKMPVVSGNVSFYNETEGHPVPPTPTIAVLGVLHDLRNRIQQFFAAAGDAVLMVQTTPLQLVASEYSSLFGPLGGGLQPVDLERERALIEGLVVGAERRLIRSAHDVSQGGLAVTLVESCLNPSGRLGVEIDGDTRGLSNEQQLFGEGPSTVVLSAAAENVPSLMALLAERGLDCRVIGRVGGGPRFRISPAIDEDIHHLAGLYERALPRRIVGGA